MSEVGGDWRIGPAYDYVDQLSVEKIAHEFLRRNDEYVADYAALRAAPNDEQSQPALTRWGLRFRCGPAHPRRPNHHGVAAAGRQRPRTADPPSGRAVYVAGSCASRSVAAYVGP